MSFTTINLIRSASDFRGDHIPINSRAISLFSSPLDLETLFSRFHVSRISGGVEEIGGKRGISMVITEKSKLPIRN